ncbi:MAG: hypothetical protein H6712_19655 [Myxococcales bacterium]|nr:hypothetical protein [Myxococcales bacterium]MCB9716093.1 hypothetical protein [Myxococcales bacterium]
MIRPLAPRLASTFLAGGLLASALLAPGCKDGYDNNDGELAVRQKAKEMCSCVFVMKQDEQWCRDWTKVTPDVADAEIDHERRRVTAVALGLYRSAASFREGLGCALEE